jgi:DNA-binding XRE family transcriptional regulator
MQAVVKTPLIKINISGRISKRLLTVLKEEFGSDVKILPEKEDLQKEDIFETEWYKNIKKEMTPGEYMKIYRQNRQMTQAQLGELLGGLPRQHISNMESGKRAISVNIAKKLSKIFNVPIDRFIK